jgi:hypothetical protein
MPTENKLDMSIHHNVGFCFSSFLFHINKTPCSASADTNALRYVAKAALSELPIRGSLQGLTTKSETKKSNLNKTYHIII